ncbi:major facilitator superfamily domain-containing protein [Hyaloraphidium curvatum]|nr:major facilitator superfamily domain-containing protein [Hyaloraphidium curvatum]
MAVSFSAAAAAAAGRPLSRRPSAVTGATAPFVPPGPRRRMSIVSTVEAGDYLFSLPRERRKSEGSVSVATAAGAGADVAPDEYSDSDSDDDDLDLEMGPPAALKIDTGAVPATGGPTTPAGSALSPGDRPPISSAKGSSASLAAQRFTPGRRRFILLVVSSAGLVAPLCTTIYLPALKTIQNDLGTTEVLINLTVTLFVVVLGIAPLIWAPLSDTLGRRPVYLLTLSLLVVSSAACAGSVNVWMLLAFRMLQAAGSSSVLSIGAGSISDIYPAAERGKALGTFYLGPLVGPVIGPVIGGTLAQYAGWRWIFGFVAIVSAILLVLIYFVLPETLRRPKGARPRPSFASNLLELRHANVSLVVLDVCIIFLALYGVTTLFGRSMSNAYGFTESQVGLLYVAQGVGNVIGSLFGGWYSDRTMNRATPPGGSPPPEARLGTTWLGAVLLPAGLLLYGWGLQALAHPAVPVSGTVLLGAGLMVSSTSVNTYLVDCYPKASASIISTNNLFRYLVSASAPIFVPYMIAAMGNGWTQTFFAVLNLLGWLGVLAVWKFGGKWRANAAAKAEEKAAAKAAAKEAAAGGG